MIDADALQIERGRNDGIDQCRMAFGLRAPGAMPLFSAPKHRLCIRGLRDIGPTGLAPNRNGRPFPPVLQIGDVEPYFGSMTATAYDLLTAAPPSPISAPLALALGEC